MNVRKISLVLLATMLVIVVAACGKNSNKESVPLTKVKFSEVIRSIFYAPHYIAMSKGFFKEQGLDVDMNTAQGSDKGAAALIAGTADISLVGPETSIYIYNQKGDKTLKVFHQLTSKDGSFLLSREKLDNFKWSDLQGKTIIGWRPGSAPQMVLNSTLLKEQAKDVKVVTNIAAPAMAGAFASGQGDFIQLFEPVASTLVKEGKAYFAASLGEAFGPFPETSYVATSDFIRKNPQTIQKFTTAVAEGARWLSTASKDEITQALKPFFEGTPEDIIIQSVERYKSQGTWSTDPQLTKEQFDILQNVLVENGVLKADEKIASMDDVVDMSFVKNIGKSD
ncbi:ABC transporter substrate-binding protein [Cohnella abietis]|uniref:Nitrate ABC transporter substrate-binding protein n=1 Tax=Cohnella abietis TaxID=2507935 RepID=A0A3T1DB57_9BACL|nr:ABC transporter substrate-binding protein [Cohnella abietis]BBI35361.1 nitrate ABC transporter substrate-binding protein [Cohnella abietis]